jgi:hypothetical protein
MPQTEEIAWRHVWLKSVLIDAGKPPNEISSSKGNKANDSSAASGKASESNPRTAAIVDGEVD